MFNWNPPCGEMSVTDVAAVLSQREKATDAAAATLDAGVY